MFLICWNSGTSYEDDGALSVVLILDEDICISVCAYSLSEGMDQSDLF